MWNDYPFGIFNQNTKMNTIISVFTVIFTLMAHQDKATLPQKWSPDFTIELSFSGSMDGSSTKLVYRYDSCIYEYQHGMKKPGIKKFALSEEDRVNILDRLRELKIIKTKSEPSLAPVDDGWSSHLCFGAHCISGGTSAEMSDEHKEIYNEAYAFLENFAATKKSR